MVNDGYIFHILYCIYMIRYTLILSNQISHGYGVSHYLGDWMDDSCDDINVLPNYIHCMYICTCGQIATVCSRIKSINFGSIFGLGRTGCGIVAFP